MALAPWEHRSSLNPPQTASAPLAHGCVRFCLSRVLGWQARRQGYGHSPPCMSRPPLSHAQEEQMLHHLAGVCWRGDWARTGRGWGFSQGFTPPPNQAIKQCFLLTVCGHHLSRPSATGSLGSLRVSLPCWTLRFSSLRRVHTCRGARTVWGTCDPRGNHAEKCRH